MPNAPGPMNPGPMTNPGSKAPAVGRQPFTPGGSNQPVSTAPTAPTADEIALHAALAPYTTTVNGQAP